MSKINAVINFNDNTLTLTKGTNMLSGEAHILWVVDPLGDTLYKNDGYDTSVFTSPDLTGSGSLSVEIELSEDDLGAIVQGTYTIYGKSLISGKVQTYTYTVIYCVELPEIDIEIDYDCYTSSLTSTDVTDYTLLCTCCNAEVEPSSTVLQHTISYPTTMEEPEDDIVDTTSVVTVTPIWTKRWVSKIENFLRYEMPAVCFTGRIYYEVQGTVDGIRYKDVLCDDCLCEMYACIKKLYNSYMVEIGRNPALAEQYESWLIRLNSLYMLYNIARNCGDEAEFASICAQIKAVINLSGCTCCEQDATNDYSVEVVALGGTGGGSSFGGTIWYSNSGAPSPSQGNVGDFYLDVVAKSVYKKLAGGWTLQFTMSLTGDFGNFIVDFDYDGDDTTSNIYDTLYEYEFDSNEYKLDGSCMVLTANMFIEEPVGEGTALQLILSGNSANTTETITIDTGTSLGLISGNKYALTLVSKYFIQNVTSVATVVGVSHIVFANGGIAYYNYKTASVPFAATGNTLTLYAKTNGVTEIATDTVNVVLETKL